MPKRSTSVAGAMRRGERDDTTRYLCAAAHLDDRFADRVIREFLTEPTRGFPPTAGVRAGAVLAEAVAARARRKIRDALLLALFLLALFVFSKNVLFDWVVLSVLVTIGSGLAAAARREAGTTVRMLLATAVGLVALLIFFVPVEDNGESSSNGAEAAEVVLSVMAFFGVLTVLLVDELVVRHHLENRFRRGQVIQDPEDGQLSAQVRQVYTFGSEHFLRQLRRHLHSRHQWFAPPRPGEITAVNGSAPVPAPVIIARGYRMFVGAGEPHEPWSMAVPLQPRPDADRVVRLTPEVLYQRIDAAMDTLREAAHLSPSRRFAGLRVTEQIVVAAEELIDHPDLAGDFLASPTASPYPLLRGQRVRELRDDPLESARYYLRFEVETWDRDFVVSAFLHLAVSDATLYVEWTPCLLMPIKARYRAIDSRSGSVLPPVRHALLTMLTLPATLPSRLRALFSRITPVGRAADMISPDMYGVEHTVRELAADTAVHNYFQLADRDRYLKMLESRLTLALVDALSAAGYSVATLEQQVATVANNNVYITNGSFTGNMVTGKGNTAVSVNTAPATSAAS